jgi:hypothetical protein
LALGALFDGQLTGNGFSQNVPMSLSAASDLSSSASPEAQDMVLGQNFESSINTLPLLDHDTMTMWSTAPTGFE